MWKSINLYNNKWNLKINVFLEMSNINHFDHKRIVNLPNFSLLGNIKKLFTAVSKWIIEFDELWSQIKFWGGENPIGNSLIKEWMDGQKMSTSIFTSWRNTFLLLIYSLSAEFFYHLLWNLSALKLIILVFFIFEIF